MPIVLVIAETQPDGSLRKASLNAITAGKQLADKAGAELHAAVFAKDAAKAGDYDQRYAAKAEAIAADDADGFAQVLRPVASADHDAAAYWLDGATLRWPGAPAGRYRLVASSSGGLETRVGVRVRGADVIVPLAPAGPIPASIESTFKYTGEGVALAIPDAMRARVRERDVEAVGELEELRAPLGHARDRLGERLALARADLGLGGDQLAREHAVEHRALRRRSEVLEAVDEVVRLGVEERELLLDGEREVVGGLEPLPGGAQLLVRGQTLRVSHSAAKVSKGK